MFYLHPWRFDPDQPRLKGSWLTRTRHYSNLSQTGGRLRRLLADFSFDTVAAAVGASEGRRPGIMNSPLAVTARVDDALWDGFVNEAPGAALTTCPGGGTWWRRRLATPHATCLPLVAQAAS